MRTKGAFAAAVAAVMLLGACGPGGTNIEAARREAASRNASRAAESVKPPKKADERLTGRVGLIVATNSKTWAKLIGAPEAPGVAVLFVQPGGPAEGAGLKRGDVITAVDGEASPNAELAVVQLRARPEDKRAIRYLRAGGEAPKTVTIAAEKPGEIDLSSLYAPLIAKSPGDALLYFLRAQAGGRTYADALADVSKAVELVPSFVEAIGLRAELQWNHAPGLEGEAAEALRDKALADWRLALGMDADNTRVITTYSQALAQRNNTSLARTQAEKALELDAELAGAHYSLANAQVALARYGEAAEPARKAIDLNPYNVTYYQLLAIVFLRLERKDDCIETIEAIVGLIDDAGAKTTLRATCETAG